MSASLPLPLDLNDPVVENEVADAIRRLAPEGAYVPLSQRYPWRFSEPTAGAQDATLLDAVVAALRGSADVHEAERIPHLVGPLREIAIALERGALVPGPPPGPCPEYLDLTLVLAGETIPNNVYCTLLAGHAGMHADEAGARWLRTAPEHAPDDDRIGKIRAELEQIRGTETPVPYEIAMTLERIAGLVGIDG